MKTRPSFVTLVLVSLWSAWAVGQEAGTPKKTTGGQPGKVKYHFPPGDSLEGSLPGDEFYFAHAIGKGVYVQLEAGLAGQTSQHADARVKEAHSYRSGYAVIADPGKQPNPSQSPREWAGEWIIRQGAQKVCSGKLGEVGVVGLIVPHFGEEQQFAERKVRLDSKEAADFRQSLFLGAQRYQMARVKGCRIKADPTAPLWAHPASLEVPLVAALVAATPQDGKAHMDRTAALSAWIQVRDRVRAAYREAGEEKEPDATRQVSSCRLPGVDKGKDRRLVHVFLQIGTTSCGAGPAEGFVSTLWDASAESQNPLLQISDGAYPTFHPQLVLQPYVDGSLYLMAILDDITGELGYFVFEKGVLRRLKSSAFAYHDCPC